jgi:hypothetical protein
MPRRGEEEQGHFLGSGLFSLFTRRRRRKARREDEADGARSAEQLQENIRRENCIYLQILDVEKEQMRRELRAAVEKADNLEAELHTIRKLMEDQKAETDYEIVSMWRKINELEDEVFPEINLGDDSPNQSEHDDHDTADEGDITEGESWYCSTETELTENNWNTTKWEIVERAEERSEEACATSSVPGAATTSGSYDGAGSSTPVPPAAGLSDGSNEGQSEKCPICLCEFVTQEVATPGACNHTFCADCLQQWSKKSNICPVDRKAYDIILARRRLGGKVVWKMHVGPPRELDEDHDIYYFMVCDVCGNNDPVHTLLLCERCGQGRHLECLSPVLDPEPLDGWICRDCS